MAAAVGRDNKLYTTAHVTPLSYTKMGDDARCHAVDDRERYQHQPVFVWSSKVGAMIWPPPILFAGQLLQRFDEFTI